MTWCAGRLLLVVTFTIDGERVAACELTAEPAALARLDIRLLT